MASILQPHSRDGDSNRALLDAVDPELPVLEPRHVWPKASGGVEDPTTEHRRHVDVVLAHQLASRERGRLALAIARSELSLAGVNDVGTGPIHRLPHCEKITRAQ